MEQNNFKKLFTHYYWIKRSQEFKRTHDSEATWNIIQTKIEKKRHKSILYNSVIATSIAAAIALVSFMLLKSMPVESFDAIVPQSLISNSVVLITDDEKMYNLQTEAPSQCNNTNLAYDSLGVIIMSSATANPTVMQTISVPFAKRYRVILPDSTIVWLNSDTKLRFAQCFNNVRQVELTGEAYFEVKRDVNKPFIIQIGKNKIEVLGTIFTVTNYNDLPVSTTLVEGSVKTITGVQEQILTPNQRAEIDTNGNISISTVDASQAISWVSGIYEFNNQSLEYITSYISRMYGVIIRIDNKELQERRLTGIVNSNENIDYSLNLIKKILGVKITIGDKEIVIQ